ncbi:MAG: phosphoadenylyl-sulfate reductase [Deltaproteobacteria bacterium]|nr:phosphoadenylyl-sulfate reductase [Deltaproteobacteria bacterium]
MSAPVPLATGDARELLRATVAQFGPRAALVSALGPQTLCILQLLRQEGLSLPTFFLDTGCHFAETLAFRQEVERHFGVEVHAVRPALDPGPLHATDPERCCAIRKVQPLQQLLGGFEAWVSGIRAEQTADRAEAAAVEWDLRFGLWKVNPLLGWSRATVDEFLSRHGVPTNPLLASGYRSIGCAPCTQPSTDERGGRWPGLAKTECGLHRRSSA